MRSSFCSRRLASSKGSVLSRSLLSSWVLTGSAWTVKQPLQGGLGFIIAAFKLRADASLFDQLHRGEKQILQDSQFVLIKLVHGSLSWRGVIAQIAKDFAHMGPIFLFDMGIVILFVGTTAGELDFVLITEGLEVIVDKF